MIIDKTFASSTTISKLFPVYVDIYGTPDADTWDAPASFAGERIYNYRIFAGDGPDTVHAGSGQDQVYGGEGNDHLFGEGGNDYLDGGAGADVMVGGTGDDSYVVDDARDTVSENLNEGVDEVWSYLPGRTDLPPNVENLHLMGLAQDCTGNNLDNKIFGNDLANTLSGADGNDQLDGGLDNDSISGDAGHDLIWGGDGHDHLIGGSGNDVLSGGTGSDDITGGQGADTLIGGDDPDRFHFDSIFETGVSLSTMDVILDFDSRGFRFGDQIVLSKIDADEFLPGDQAFAFIGNQSFSAVGQVRYDQVGSDFIIWLNTDSDSNPEAGIFVRTDTTTPIGGHATGSSVPDASWFAL